MVPADPRAAARQRHPSSSYSLPEAALRARLADVLAVDGMLHAEVALAVLEARGRSGLSIEEFARRAGVSVEEVAAAEAGALARHQLPRGLRHVVPMPEPSSRRLPAAPPVGPPGAPGSDVRWREPA